MIEIERFKFKDGGLDKLNTRQEWYPEQYFYRPISMNIQGDTYCPVGCVGCGIDSQKNMQSATKLPEVTRLQILEQSYDAGFISYLGCVGKAEPFMSLQFLGKVIELFNGRLDNTKINTSCNTFGTLDSAIKQLRYLKDKGWTDTTYVVPVLSLSLGMQQEAGVPIERVVNGIMAFHEVFTSNEARLSISHYHTSKKYINSVDVLAAAYKRLTNRNLHEDAVIKTNEIIYAGRATQLSKDEFEQFQLKDKTSCLKCFGMSVAEYIDPVMTVDEYGNIWMCPSFGPHEGTLLGNIRDITIKQAIIEANQNNFFRLIARGGTKAVFEIALKYEPELEKIIVTNRHTACAILYKTFLTRQKLREEIQSMFVSD
jgi:hypothetical protein